MNKQKVQLDKQDIAKIYFFLRDVDDAINFMMVNKKVQETRFAITTNPYYPRYKIYSTSMKQRNRKNDVIKETMIFPNIQTLVYQDEFEPNEITQFNLIRIENGVCPSNLLINKMTKQCLHSFYSMFSNNVRELYIEVNIETFRYHIRNRNAHVYKLPWSKGYLERTHLYSSMYDNYYNNDDEITSEDESELKTTEYQTIYEAIKAIDELPYLELVRLRFKSRQDGFFDARINTPQYNDYLIEIAKKLHPENYIVIFDLDFPNQDLLRTLKEEYPLINVVTQIPRRVDSSYVVTAVNNDWIYYMDHEIISLKRMKENDFRDIIFPKYLFPKITIDEDSRHSGYFQKDRKNRRQRFDYDQDHFWSYDKEKGMKHPENISNFHLYELDLKFCLTGKKLVVPTTLTKLHATANRIDNLNQLTQLKELSINVFPPFLPGLQTLKLENVMRYPQVLLNLPTLKRLSLKDCFMSILCPQLQLYQLSNLFQLEINNSQINEVILPMNLKILKCLTETRGLRKLPILRNIDQLKLKILLIKNVAFTTQQQFRLNFEEMTSLIVPDELILNRNEYKGDTIPQQPLQQPMLTLNNPNNNNINNTNQRTSLTQNQNNVLSHQQILQQVNKEMNEESESIRRKNEHELNELTQNIKSYEERVESLKQDIEKYQKQLETVPRFQNNSINLAYVGWEKRLNIALKNKQSMERELELEKIKYQKLLSEQQKYQNNPYHQAVRSSIQSLLQNTPQRLSENQQRQVEIQQNKSTTQPPVQQQNDNSQQKSIQEKVQQNNNQQKQNKVEIKQSNSQQKSSQSQEKVQSQLQQMIVQQKSSQSQSNDNQSQEINDYTELFNTIHQMIPKEDYVHWVPNQQITETSKQCKQNFNQPTKRYEYLNGQIETITLTVHDILK